MLSQTIPIHQHSSNTNVNDVDHDKDDVWFDAFNFAPGQDENIRWLSRPNQQFLKEILSKDAEKFRVTFDVENFQADQIKVYIVNRQLTISGIYEERTEGRYTQKQFEKSFDIPENANVSAMAAYLTPAHMLVVEIPLNLNSQPHLNNGDTLNVNANNQRRLSFSLNKFNTMNNQSLLSTSNNTSTLSAPSSNQQVRRTSITKTVTTTTTTKPVAVPISFETTNRIRTQEPTSIISNERCGSKGAVHQVIINEPSSTPSLSTPISADSMDLASLGIEFPPELLKLGGTITIQKRRVSVTRTADTNANRSTSTTVTNDISQPLTPTTLEKTSFQPNISGRRGSTTVLTNNERKVVTLEEFLQNKIWNPSIVNDSNDNKILHMHLEMKPGTTADQLRITLNGHDLRVEVNNNKIAVDSGELINNQSYQQITLFPACDIHQLATALETDGFLHIQVPIQL